MRNDLDAMRAKNEALEAENRNLRQKLEEQMHPKEKFWVKVWRLIKTAWEFFLGLGATFGWFKVGGTAAGALVLALFVPMCNCTNAAWHRHLESERRAAVEAEEAAAAEEEARAEERDAAHRAMLEQMSAHTPRGVDYALWTWCVDHCARYHRVGASYYSEGIVTAVGRDGAGETIRVESPIVNWTTEHGPFNAFTYSLRGVAFVPSDARIGAGSLIAITVTPDMPMRIDVIGMSGSEYAIEHEICY